MMDEPDFATLFDLKAEVLEYEAALSAAIDRDSLAEEYSKEADFFRRAAAKIRELEKE